MAGLSQNFLLKDVFNAGVIKELAANIKKNYAAFDKKNFCQDCINELETLSFLERSRYISKMLHKYLPADYKKAVTILIKSLGPELEEAGETDWNSFIVMPQCYFVSQYGKDNFDLSMKALYEMTKRFTAEGDLRTFIELDYKKAMALLEKWCQDKSHHVRRLVSEGTRPRLPLAGRIERFQKDPKPVIKLLEKLKNDPHLYVRRSVANNINDIAKDNPKTAVALLKKWNKEKSENIKWLVKHASRGLLKEGNTDVLEFLGYPVNAKIMVSKPAIEPDKIKRGKEFSFDIEIQNIEKNDVTLMIDYVVHFVKANRKTKDKVFKLKTITLKGKEKIKIKRKQHLRDTAGRKHYAGVHYLELQINGKRYSKAKFVVE